MVKFCVSKKSNIFFYMKNILNDFVMFLEKKYLAPLRIVYPFIKSFVNPFVHIGPIFFLIAHLINFQ